MDFLQAIVLGVLQGVTEWLPVSSSGHLVLAQKLMGLSVPVFFDVALHVGTLLAVLVYFRRDLIEMASGKNLRLVLLVLVAAVPTAIIGLAFKDFFEQMFSSVFAVGAALVLTGVLLFLSSRARETRTALGWLDAAIVGIAQGLAIMPGLSRSGATISAGLFRGLSREEAARFSFLIAVPAVAGAALLEGRHAALSSELVAPTIVGAVVAAFVGYASIAFLLGFIKKHDFKPFAYYCLALGTVVVASTFFL